MATSGEGHQGLFDDLGLTDDDLGQLSLQQGGRFGGLFTGHAHGDSSDVVGQDWPGIGIDKGGS